MTTPLNTRILIADDHPVVLRGLRNLLNAHSDLKVVAEATDGEQALERALAEDLHLAILDISMPRMTGLDAAREITRRRPDLRVLMLSMHDNEQYLVAEAHTNGEIAELLRISKKTVERHRANVLDKLGMRDRVELTRYAIRRGLVEL
jgi:DNA-binding NarL/FixJ family response regulator